MKNQNFARILALIMAVILLLSAIIMPALADSENNVVTKPHYPRPDKTFSGRSVRFRNCGQKGTDVPLAEENGEMVATFEVVL